MPTLFVVPGNGVFAALQAMCCPPEELAQALGVDLRTLWSYYGEERHIPSFVLQRLVEVLHHRAKYLREVALMLDTTDGLREPPIAS
jgi:hypothetical protein